MQSFLEFRRYIEWYAGCFSLICQYCSLYFELTVQRYNIGYNGNRPAWCKTNPRLLIAILVWPTELPSEFSELNSVNWIQWIGVAIVTENNRSTNCRQTRTEQRFISSVEVQIRTLDLNQPQLVATRLDEVGKESVDCKTTTKWFGFWWSKMSFCCLEIQLWGRFPRESYHPGQKPVVDSQIWKDSENRKTRFSEPDRFRLQRGLLKGFLKS